MAINASGYSTTRISGMYSGLDTESLVKSMMSAEQTKYDKLFQSKEKAQWRRDAYTSINNSVSSLRNSFLSVLGDKSVMSGKTYNAFKVNMNQNAALKITGTATADAGSFTVLSTKMATAASATRYIDSKQAEAAGAAGKFLRTQASGKLSLPEGKAAAETTIGELASQFGLEEGENLEFTINGESFTFSQDETLADMQDKINAGTTAKVSMDIADDGAVTFKSNDLGADSKIDFANNKGKAFGEGGAFGIGEGAAKQLSVVDVNVDTFESLARELGVTVGAGSTFSINGNEFSLYGMEVDGEGNAAEPKTIQAVMDEVNSANIGVKMSYDATTGSFSIRNISDGNDDTTESKGIEVEGEFFSQVTGIEEGTHADTGSVRRSDTLATVARKLGNTLSGDTLNVTINGKDFSFNVNSTTLSDMMNTINNDSELAATFSFSELADSFKIASEATGAGAALSFSGFEELFGIEDATALTGSNAEMKILIDGKERTVSQATNNFTLDGLQFEITADETFANGGMAVSVEQDYQSTVDAVKGFIEEYNKLIEELNGYYYDDTNGGYEPLTDDQRAEMTEKEQELWDEKAKSGILRNDATIGNLLSNLRSSLYNEVGETGMSAYDLGITTVGWGSDWKTSQGKLQLDEDKLLAALKENPDAVQDVLTKVASNTDGSADTSVSGSGANTSSNSGLFVQMNSFLSGFNSTMRSYNISGAQKSIDEYTDRMSDLLDRMSEKEEKYWQQFSALETAMSELQSQSSYFASMLGMGTTQQ